MPISLREKSGIVPQHRKDIERYMNGPGIAIYGEESPDEGILKDSTRKSIYC